MTENANELPLMPYEVIFMDGRGRVMFTEIFMGESWWAVCTHFHDAMPPGAEDFNVSDDPPLELVRQVHGLAAIPA